MLLLSIFYPSLLGEGDLHGRRRRDLEALQCVSGGRGLDLVLELDESDVVTARNQANLFEAGELKRMGENVLFSNAVLVFRDFNGSVCTYMN